jgi:hypothetical protein
MPREKKAQFEIKMIGSESDQKTAAQPLTDKEKAVRKAALRGAGGFGKSANYGMGYSSGDMIGGAGGNFYSPQLSTDFLEQPQNLRERRAWYRHFYYKHELVGAAIDLHSTIPLSKIRLLRPKSKNPKFAQYVHDFYVDLCDNMKLFKRLMEISHEYWLMGGAFVFVEEHQPYPEGLNSEHGMAMADRGAKRSNDLYTKFGITDRDPNYMGWKSISILPPDQVRLQKVMFSDAPLIEFLPDDKTKSAILADYAEGAFEGLSEGSRPNIPSSIKNSVQDGGAIPLDTDPNSGSHCSYLCRKKSQYEVYGQSILERCIQTLLLSDKLRQAQTSIASRHMTPMRIVWADQLSETDIDDLRAQVDWALMDPDYSIVANYEIHWDEMGTSGRLLDLTAEYEHHEKLLYAGLGVTEDLLTGGGAYSGGSKVSLELLNIQYTQFREMLIDWIENNLFKPVAIKKGFVEYDEFGREHLIYPKVSFTRLSIRDAESSFEQLFQLYQKGSLPIDVILEMLNVDPDIARQRLESDLFTVNDSTFNEFLRAVYGAVGNDFGNKTNIAERLAQSMSLAYSKGQDGGGDSGGGGDAGGLRFASGETQPPAPEVVKDSSREVQSISDDLHYLLEASQSDPEKIAFLANLLRKRKGETGK